MEKPGECRAWARNARVRQLHLKAQADVVRTVARHYALAGRALPVYMFSPTNIHEQVRQTRPCSETCCPCTLRHVICGMRSEVRLKHSVQCPETNHAPYGTSSHRTEICTPESMFARPSLHTSEVIVRPC